MNELTFQRITNWQKKTFPTSTFLSMLTHLKEEIEEVKYDLIEGNQDRVPEEYADCFLLLIGSAAAFGMSLGDINRAIEAKMSKNERRVWNSPDQDGVIRHVKE